MNTYKHQTSTFKHNEIKSNKMLISGHGKESVMKIGLTEKIKIVSSLKTYLCKKQKLF